MAARHIRKIPIAHKATQRQQRMLGIVSLLLLGISLYFAELDVKQLAAGLDRLPAIGKQLAQLSFANAGELLRELVTSIIVAFLSVIFSVAAALFLAFLVAENTAPNRLVGRSLNAVFVIIRTIPTTIWVLLAVASMGFGPMAGVLGLMFPTASYLIRTFAAQIEEAGGETIEAIRSVGGTWWHVIAKGMLPTLLTAFLATTAFRFEISVAESVILGMVGAGGIGSLLQGYISYYQFADLSLGILMVFFTMFLLEMGTVRIRKRIAKQG
ncbi:binding-protein-dependent transport systems inner membrane component [Paenibacillus mucilaginosus 3016]|uniref:Binding-protein-dependent transport systems inner membrane component n=2 Tax=Paenibacillus mucilaginosus TaxID=61624 RepID=H6NI34_9BACL|nr:ABC transporter permease subunit [Paenibacillus mucilaginosus]AFC30805.1 binding-protein-dependent transport systems inner membrane component [Paenibacillus mucilaginosus 3016]AFH63127.1 ABC transporter permease [Paenibacillus mucilaginosus K02]WFA19411.1 ABC transporter permease subunit [Paenibacillus mucilaginosus]